MAGRKPFEPTEKQRITVAAMAACGMPQDMICSKIKNPQTGKAVDTKTLRAAFRVELKEAKALASAMVAQNLFQHAMGKGREAVTAGIFWMKCQAGWKEAQKVELTGKDGAPIQNVNMTPEEFREIARQLLEEV